MGATPPGVQGFARALCGPNFVLGTLRRGMGLLSGTTRLKPLSVSGAADGMRAALTDRA
jgi:hypothetical protein